MQLTYWPQRQTCNDLLHSRRPPSGPSCAGLTVSSLLQQHFRAEKGRETQGMMQPALGEMLRYVCL
jgi:hypothetical protein